MVDSAGETSKSTLVACEPEFLVHGCCRSDDKVIQAQADAMAEQARAMLSRSCLPFRALLGKRMM